MAISECPICKAANVAAIEQSEGVDSYQISCPICGSYEVSGSAITMFTNIDKDFELSYAIGRRNLRKEKVYVNTVNRDDILDGIEMPTRIKDIAELILTEVYKNEESSANGLVISEDNISLYAIENMNKLRMVLQYVEDADWFTLEKFGSGAAFITITGAGIEHAENIINPNFKSSKVFVAMSFNPELDIIYRDAIKKAVEECGLKPIRIDLEYFNDEIISNILQRINKSRFLIADYTDNRPGVYFETGYAIGKGLPVIYCCRKSDKGNIHFDVDHYNFINWEEVNDFKSGLVKRITNTGLNT